MNSGARARACRRRAGDGALADPSICVWRRALRECREMNFPGAEDVSRALNRSDAGKTDQEHLSPSAVRLLTSEAISAFGGCPIQKMPASPLSNASFQSL